MRKVFLFLLILLTACYLQANAGEPEKKSSKLMCKIALNSDGTESIIASGIVYRNSLLQYMDEGKILKYKRTLLTSLNYGLRNGEGWNGVPETGYEIYKHGILNRAKYYGIKDNPDDYEVLTATRAVYATGTEGRQENWIFSIIRKRDIKEVMVLPENLSVEDPPTKLILGVYFNPDGTNIGSDGSIDWKTPILKDVDGELAFKKVKTLSTAIHQGCKPGEENYVADLTDAEVALHAICMREKKLGRIKQNCNCRDEINNMENKFELLSYRTYWSDKPWSQLVLLDYIEKDKLPSIMSK